MGAVNFQPGSVRIASMNPLLSVPGFPMEIKFDDGTRDSIPAEGFMELQCPSRRLVDALDVSSIDVLPRDMRKTLALVLNVDDSDLPVRVCGMLKAHLEQYVNLHLHSNDPIRVSPLAVFLEGLWREVVIQTAKGDGT